MRLLFYLTILSTVIVAQEPILVDETVAKVNNDIITRSALLKAQQEYRQELALRFPDDLKKQEEEYARGSKVLLDVLIEEKLINQRAQELSIDVEADINRAILELARQTNPQWTLKDFEEYLKSQGIDIEEVRKNYRSQLQRRVLLFREVISPIYERLKPEEKRQWYEQHKELFKVPGEYKLSEIFISFEGKTEAAAEALARQAVSEARSGIPFEQLVAKYSDPARPSSTNKGHLPDIKENELIEYLRKALARMQPGEVSDPIRTDKGYQVIWIREHKRESTIPYAEVEQQVAEQLAIERGQEKLKDYFKSLREKAYIKIAENYKEQQE
ncbi:MAG: peptidyl-prolyl cis-trans isomerase [Acidobacteriota bacterium]|nr:peptidyl-prolyl cis-trans isomerase [Blastocatellia bacterium]MDW8411498.1 peptidyl-prolyl cis-trans isomerase [Acidobacteriota bacterium]